MREDSLVIHTDGGSRGNPGPAACAFVAQLNEEVVGSGSEFLGTKTNNYAEYRGVILALNWLIKNKNNYGIKEILFLLDSELVVKQLNGIYKIKKQDLLTLSLSVRKLVSEFSGKVIFKNVPREQNKKADLLLNQELDKHQ